MAWGPSWGASSLASMMPTELWAVPFEKRFTTVFSAAALVFGALTMVHASTTAARPTIGRQQVQRGAEPLSVARLVNSLLASEALACLMLKGIMGSPSAFTVPNLGRNTGGFGSSEARMVWQRVG